MHQILLLTGFFLLPFENLAVAPSRGWPAITPVIMFFTYIATPTRHIPSPTKLLPLITILLWTTFSWLITQSVYEGNRYFYRDIIDASMPAIMGLSFYGVMRTVFFIDNSVEVSMIRRSINAYITGSILALFVSLLILLLGYLGQEPWFLSILDIVLKRNSDVKRFSFLFAEPSFISVHILGVITPLLWLSNKLNLRAETRNLKIILFIYLTGGLLFSGSVRFLLDITLISALYFSIRIILLDRQSDLGLFFLKFLLLIGFCGAFYTILVSSPQIITTLTMGRVNYSSDLLVLANSDGSLATRFFLMNAVIKGMSDQSTFLITGAGFGNIGYLVDAGYDAAMIEYTSTFRSEVNTIGEIGSGPTVYNMPAKLTGEFGIVVALAFFIILFDRRLIFLYLSLLVCLLQFDSYAFYGIWFYAIIRKIENMEAQPETYAGAPVTTHLKPPRKN